MNNIRIVLVRTSHPGNIGAVARAMRTMGIKQLALVSPKSFPHAKATARASGALDVLEQALVVETLEEAISDCQLVIGTSARNRNLAWPQLTPEACACKLYEESQHAPTALVFGSERMGLENHELALCHFQATIPSMPDFSSLNLAAAVQLFTYELRKLVIQPIDLQQDKEEYASSDEISGFYQHLERTLQELQFLKEENPGRLMLRMRRLFSRTRLEKTEINILRGILKAIQNGNGIAPK